MLVFVASLTALAAPPPAADDTLPPVNSAGGPDPLLNADEQQQWLRGRRVFTRKFRLGDGLGPLFDADSCAACHRDPVIGGAGDRSVNVVRFGFHDLANDVFTDVEGGPVVSKLAIPGRPREEVNPAANVTQERQPPSLLGLGLIDRLPDSVIEANVIEDEDQNGLITGAAARIGGRVARFGHKADIPTLRDAVADALGNYMGITLDRAASAYARSSDDDDVADPELAMADFDDLVFFVSHLAPPVPSSEGLNAALVAAGRDLFEPAGCGACHVPQLINTEDGTQLNLYSDLLLHRLLPPASADPDSIPDVTSGVALPREFRTPPLWGFRNTAPYIHDGKALTLEQIMSRHAWESLASARTVINSFTDDERAALLEFLRSL